MFGLSFVDLGDQLSKANSEKEAGEVMREHRWMFMELPKLNQEEYGGYAPAKRNVMKKKAKVES